MECLVSDTGRFCENTTIVTVLHLEIDLRKYDPTDSLKKLFFLQI